MAVTTQIRTYTVKEGLLDAWVRRWKEEIVPLRLEFGFSLGGAWIDRERHHFIWVISYDGPQSFAERLSGLATSLRPEHEGADAHARRMIHRHSDATRSFVALADQLGVSVRAPFFDNSVVAACMSVAARERATALEAKPLLRAAVSDVMPGELYARRTKGDYGGCEYQGLRRNAARVRDLLREARLFDLRIVRPDPVIRALDSAIDGGTAPMAALHGVLAVETWLRAQDTRSDHPHRRVSRLPIGASP